METIHNEIDSFVKDHWSSSQKQKAETVLSFVQNLMNDHNFELIRQQYSNASYKQHNRSMKDGIEGVLTSVSTLTKRFPDFAYEVKNIFVDGDYVTLHSHATVNKKHRGNDRKGPAGAPWGPFGGLVSIPDTPETAKTHRPSREPKGAEARKNTSTRHR